ncbi:creatininase family protein [Natrarchaeobius oligotrophus]|uniref:Creatininase family protein n=1 Tax=Natrarchaeobius chitinivorans TaxID=1679083 RepID=A0A3N6MY85_NATCH|nr:creatininase family protein [Natrarchaeobius chitinivorans]RQH01422.1 creatininase family protein [Natrarchaeobius chitinivorans]
MVYEGIGSRSGDWAGKTCGEVREIGERDGSILVVPVGSVEQHGHHLPVATDTILVDAAANLAVERVEDEIPILTTPPIWSGFSPHHTSFGGTITLEFDVAMDVLESVANSALENGFDALVLLNGHGGNGALISAAVSTIGVEHPDVEVLGLTYFELAAGFVDEIRDSDVGGMAHGGEFETSLLLHLRPGLVDEDAIEATPLEEPYDLGTTDLLESGPLSVYREFEEYSHSGAIGRPELATAEKGAEIYERLGDELEALMNQIHERNA